MQRLNVCYKTLAGYETQEIEVVGGTDDAIDLQVLDWYWSNVHEWWERVKEKEDDVWA